jgi:hypothetical protein
VALRYTTDTRRDRLPAWVTFSRSR